jgi:hypothetical protein
MSLERYRKTRWERNIMDISVADNVNLFGDNVDTAKKNARNEVNLTSCDFNSVGLKARVFLSLKI